MSFGVEGQPDLGKNLSRGMRKVFSCSMSFLAEGLFEFGDYFLYRRSKAPFRIETQTFFKFGQRGFRIFKLDINIAHERMDPGIVCIEFYGLARVRFRQLPLAQSPQAAGQFIVRFSRVRTDLQAALQGLLRFSIILLLIQRRSSAQVSPGVAWLDFGGFFKGPLRVTPLPQLHLREPQKHISLSIPWIELGGALELVDAGAGVMLLEKQVLALGHRIVNFWDRTALVDFRRGIGWGRRPRRFNGLGRARGLTGTFLNEAKGRYRRKENYRKQKYRFAH